MSYQVLENGVERNATPNEIMEIELRQQEAQIKEAQEAQARLSAYMAEFRELRRELLNVLTGIAIAEEMLTEFRAARDALLDIPQIPAVANATTAEQAKAACKAAYAAVVMASPPEFINAFRELNE